MAEANNILLRAERVSRQYTMGTTVILAVDEVSFEVRAGEFVALLGSSGSGKSTLLNLMGGLDQPTSGAMFVSGQNLASMSPEELARYRRHSVGMIFQAFNLVPRMTVAENVELPLRLAEVERGERRARVEKALGRVGLQARLAHRPAELSGGEQQRVAIARALVNRPTILLADEPTGNLDSRTGTEILTLIEEINRSSGTTVVLVTHEEARADRFAKRKLYIADGRLKEAGSCN